MKKIIVAIALSFLLAPALSYARQPVVYPAEGQDAAQITLDKNECSLWAKDETGFDPAQPQEATTAPPPSTTKPGLGGSVVKGAAVGGLGGSMGGQFGKGAAVGAAVGIVGGGIRKSQQINQDKANQEQWAQQEAAQYAEKLSAYNRA